MFWKLIKQRSTRPPKVDDPAFPAFKEGRLAFSNEIEIYENPYQNSDKHLASSWASGWKEAQKARKAFENKYIGPQSATRYLGFFRKHLTKQSLPLTAEDIAAVDKLYIIARKTSTEPAELLKRSGVSEESIILAARIYRDYVEPLRNRGLNPALHFKSKSGKSKEMRIADNFSPVKKHRKKVNEGMRRLGIVTGAIFALAWVIYSAIALDGFENLDDKTWLIFFLGILFFFAIGRLLLWATNWVISGFREGDNDSNKTNS